jgi:succinate dehydrogenase hydrophobic membrane anchor protein
MGIINSGVKHWVFQRIANALFVAFGIALLCVFLSNDGMTYESLTALLQNSGWKWFFIVVLILACVNSVLAAWQIDGDYAKKFGIPQQVITITALLVSILFLYFGFKLF